MSHHDKDFSTLETVDLEHVTGGAGDSMSMMLPMMMMMRGKKAAPAAPPPPPPTPKVTLNGVEQRPTTGPNGLTFDSEA